MSYVATGSTGREIRGVTRRACETNLEEKKETVHAIMSSRTEKVVKSFYWTESDTKFSSCLHINCTVLKKHS